MDLFPSTFCFGISFLSPITAVHLPITAVLQKGFVFMWMLDAALSRSQQFLSAATIGFYLPPEIHVCRCLSVTDEKGIESVIVFR
jgi:hypothetical protein